MNVGIERLKFTLHGKEKDALEASGEAGRW